MTFLIPLGIAAIALIAGCSSGSNEPPPPKKPCNDYDDPKSICTLTFKPAGPTQVKVGTDEFVATRTNLTPVKLYPNLCSTWRPNAAYYTPPSAPYPATPDDLLIAFESGMIRLEEVTQSEEPFVQCSKGFLPEDPWGILSQEGDLYGFQPNQFLNGLKLKYPDAEFVDPYYEYRKVNRSPREIAIPFSINNKPDNTGPLSFGIAKISLPKVDPSQPTGTSDVTLLTKIDIDRASKNGDLYWSGYRLFPSQLLYLTRYTDIFDTNGQKIDYRKSAPAYAFLGDFQKQQVIKLPENLNYDPKNETTIEGKPWNLYTSYVTTEFTIPIYQSNQVWIVHAPNLYNYQELWGRNSTLEKDLSGVHYQTADATLSQMNPQTGFQTDFRIPLRNVRGLAAMHGTNQLAVVGLSAPFSLETIQGKEAATGIPTLLRIDSDGKILQSLPLKTEKVGFGQYGYSFSQDGLELQGDSFKAVYQNGQFELQPFQKPPKTTILESFTYVEWDRGGTPLQLESDRMAASGVLSLYGGVNRDYVLVNSNSKKAISWRLPLSEDPKNRRSEPCYNAAFRPASKNGAVQRDEDGNSIFAVKTCKVERGPALILPTVNGIKVFVGYNDEMFAYQIPNEGLN